MAPKKQRYYIEDGSDEDNEDDELLGTSRGGDGRKIKKSDNEPRAPSTSSSVAAGQLLSFVERIERLQEEKKAISDDEKEVYAEAKGTGFDTKAIRKIIAERKQDADARMEFETICDLYRHALGMPLIGD